MSPRTRRNYSELLATFHHGWFYLQSEDAFVYPWSGANQVVSRTAAEANPQMATTIGLDEEARAWLLQHPVAGSERPG